MVRPFFYISSSKSLSSFELLGGAVQAWGIVAYRWIVERHSGMHVLTRTVTRNCPIEVWIGRPLQRTTCSTALVSLFVVGLGPSTEPGVAAMLAPGSC